jgi:predicted ATPase/DNA-binding CsgD family transcriptional regulator
VATEIAQLRPSDNLPAELSSFVGREREKAEVARLLESEGARLVTLVGAGGVGKTRLALHVAAAMRRRYADGVWLVELAPVADPALVPQVVATALGVREQVGTPLLETLVSALKDQRLLLVLDNCEHLLEASATLAWALLRECPSLTVLATSRGPLGVPGEITWRVPSLPVPSPQPAAERVTEYAAARLFVDRVRAAVPTFELNPQNAVAVAEVCQRLDGIPLALELAAARVGHLGVGGVVMRLDDHFRLLVSGGRARPPRQQTLRATLDWGYTLLTRPAQRLLERLTVFAGGWTLDAAEAVCADDGAASEVLELLSTLVDQSLVQTEPQPDGTVRYAMLETLRQYGRERLVAHGEAEAIQRRHALFYVDLAERAAPELRGPDQARWLERLDQERDNLRTALDWLVEQGEADVALRLAAAATWYWLRRGYFTDARRLLQVLRLPGGSRGPARAGALLAAARLASSQGDYPGQAAYNEEALGIYRELDDPTGIAEAVTDLGAAAWQQGRLDDARAYLEEGLARFRALDDPVGIATALLPLGNVVRDAGDFATAGRLYAEALERRRASGDQLGVAHVLSNLGWLALYEGDLETARRLAQEGLAIRQELGARREAATSRVVLGKIALASGDRARARALLLESLAAHREVGNHWGVALALEGLALLAVGRQPELALRLAGAAAGLRAAIGRPLPPVEAPSLQRALDEARRGLSAAAAAGAWAAGYDLDDLDPAALAAAVVADEPAAPAERPGGLTAREEEVLRLVAAGYTNRQIAERLVISPGTARIHVEHIREKLGLHSRAHLAAWAIEHGLRQVAES